MIIKSTLRRFVLLKVLMCSSAALFAAGADVGSPLLHYRFEDREGAKVLDSSGRGLNGVYVNHPSWTDGVEGKALKLAGGPANAPETAYVTLPDGVLDGLDAVTVAAWVKWEGKGAWQWLFALGSDAGRYIFYTPRSGGGAMFSAIKNGGGEQSVAGAAALEGGVWHHVALTVDAVAGRSVLYIDGVKVAQNSNISIKPSSLAERGSGSSGYIGKSFFPDEGFQGCIDDFRIYGKALNAAQVGDIYGEAKPAAEAVALVRENLSIGRAVVTGDLSLPARSYGADITWRSDKPAVVSTAGKVVRPAAGQPVERVVLRAAIRKGDVSATKDFVLDVAPLGGAIKFASDNPLFKTDGTGNLIFTADPSVLVDGDTLYVYAGQDDAPIGGWFAMNRWVCYSTKDMLNWKYEGVVLNATDFSWGTAGTAWAAQVVKKNGKYYFYSSTGRPNRQGYSVGVAVSDKPTGPFVDAIKGPLFDNALTPIGPVDSFEDIDPTVLVDDDGQGYIFWGNTNPSYALLNDDMVSLKDLNGDGKITYGADILPAVINNKVGDYGEAPWLFKAKGKYYLAYASGLPQKVRYAVSDSPRGPWDYRGIILDENLRPDGSRTDYSSDTSHPAVVEFKGQWYVFYHTAGQPSGGQTRRSVAAEKIFFNADGTIRHAEITSTGVSGKASRIQSLANRDQFVRFDKFDVKLEKPADNARPFQWELTIGLSDESTLDTVAIQSVAHSGYYLTVEGDKVVLAKNDATVKFKRAASFRIVPGLGDKSGVSFQLIADPRLFIRSVNGALQAVALTPASGAADRQDATFKILQ